VDEAEERMRPMRPSSSRWSSKWILIPAAFGALHGALVSIGSCVNRQRKVAPHEASDAATPGAAVTMAADAGSPDASLLERNPADAGTPDTSVPSFEPPQAPVDDATPAPPELRDPMSTGFVVVGITKTEREATQIARSFRDRIHEHGATTTNARRWANLTSVLKLFDKPPRQSGWLWAVRVSGLTRPEAARLCLWLLRSKGQSEGRRKDGDGSDWTSVPNRVCAYSKSPWFTNKTTLTDPTSNHEKEEEP